MKTMESSGPIVIALVGPTCTGKTSISLNLAEKLNGEIVACDSRTIYKFLDIGTAKPSPAQRNSIRHHAIDVLEPTRFFTVAEYKELALEAVHEMRARGKTPIVCGGTGFYSRALLEGIEIPSIPPQAELREQLNALANEHGNAHLHAELFKLDPDTAQRLSVNDQVRIVRALEVCMVARQPFSKLAGKGPPPFKTVWIGLTFNDRTIHKQLIKKRLEDQFEEGLAEEALNLFGKPEYRAVLERVVNYKEFIPHLEENASLQHVFDQCLLHNFQLARKQMTWFRANSAIHWLRMDELSEQEILFEIIKLYSNASNQSL